tara:strand:- start:231 stop:443 length:213 start_codon:yes stop_codon:yes gene_type:complete
MWIARWWDCRFIASMNRCGGFDRVNDLLIARASTQIAFDGAGDFFSGWVLVLVEQGLGGHQETRGAKATL